MFGLKQQTPDEWYQQYNMAGIEHEFGIKEGILKLIIEHESHGDPYAKNPKSTATGLFQLTDSSNFKGDKTDPLQAARFAASLIRWGLDTYSGSYEKAIAAYSQGTKGIKPGDYIEQTAKYINFFKEKGFLDGTAISSDAHVSNGASSEIKSSPVIVDNTFHLDHPYNKDKSLFQNFGQQTREALYNLEKVTVTNSNPQLLRKAMSRTKLGKLLRQVNNSSYSIR